MPIEIREVIIRAEVRSTKEQGEPQQESDVTEQVVERCVEQIMQILDDKAKR